MRALLISANTEQVNMRTLPWGLWCVATAARAAGHAVATLDLLDAADPEAAVREAIRAHAPEVIGVSVRNIDDQLRSGPTFFLDKVRPVIQACRAGGVPVVLGGAGYSLFPGPALEYLEADLGIQGEGEVALPALLETMERGAPLSEVPGLWARGRGRIGGERRFLPCLDTAPLPDDACLASLPPVDPDRPLWVPLQIKRGCALGCAYCSTATLEGRANRRRSTAAIVDWLARHPDLAARPLYLVDNNFNVPREPAVELCRALLDRGLRLRWRCILNPLNVDEALTTLMARAGCQEVSLGHEAGTEVTLRGLHKAFSCEDVVSAARCLRAAGIRAMGFLLLGGPGETPETVDETLRFSEGLGLDSVKVTVGIRLYPDTPLAARAVAEGQVAADDDLLRPRFYLAPGLEPGIHERVAAWCATRPSWLH